MYSSAGDEWTGCDDCFVLNPLLREYQLNDRVSLIVTIQSGNVSLAQHFFQCN